MGRSAQFDILGVAFAALVLAGCGGGGGGSGSGGGGGSSNGSGSGDFNDDGERVALSGTARVAEGQLIVEAPGWRTPFRSVLDGLVAASHAATTGDLEELGLQPVPVGTEVDLVRVDDMGMVMTVIASGEVADGGEWDLDVPVGMFFPFNTFFPSDTFFPTDTFFPSDTFVPGGALVPANTAFTSETEFPTDTFYPAGTFNPAVGFDPADGLTQGDEGFTSGGDLRRGDAFFREGSFFPTDTFFPSDTFIPTDVTFDSDTLITEATQFAYAANTIVRVGGSATNAIHASIPSSGRDVLVNPVSEATTRAVIDNGGFDDLTSSKMASLTAYFLRELQAENFVFNKFGDLDMSVNQVNDLLGEEINGLVSASRGDGVSLAGSYHLSLLDVSVQGSSDEGRFEAGHRLVDPAIQQFPGGEKRIDFGGRDVVSRGIARQWTFTDNTVADSQWDTTTDTTEGSSSALAPMVVTTDGRLVFLNQDDGVVSEDGKLFALRASRGAGGNDMVTETLGIGAVQWDAPADIEPQNFNLIRYQTLVDPGLGAGAGIAMGTRVFGELECSARECSVDLEIFNVGPDPHRLIAVMDPTGDLFRDEIGDGFQATPYHDQFKRLRFILGDTGRLSEDDDDPGRQVSGLVGPDAAGSGIGLLVAHAREGGSSALYIGIPRPVDVDVLGGSEDDLCSKSTINGTYNMVSHDFRLEGEADTTVIGDEALIRPGTGRSPQPVDNGELSLTQLLFNQSTLDFNNGNAVVEVDRFSEGRETTFAPNQLTVEPGCMFVFDDSTLPAHHEPPRGVVSPDGRILVIASFDHGRASASANDAFAQLVFGFRAANGD